MRNHDCDCVYRVLRRPDEEHERVLQKVFLGRLRVPVLHQSDGHQLVRERHLDVGAGSAAVNLDCADCVGVDVVYGVLRRAVKEVPADVVPPVL